MQLDELNIQITKSGNEHDGMDWSVSVNYIPNGLWREKFNISTSITYHVVEERFYTNQILSVSSNADLTDFGCQ